MKSKKRKIAWLFCALMMVFIMSNHHMEVVRASQADGSELVGITLEEALTLSTTKEIKVDGDAVNHVEGNQITVTASQLQFGGETIAVDFTGTFYKVTVPANSAVLLTVEYKGALVEDSTDRDFARIEYFVNGEYGYFLDVANYVGDSWNTSNKVVLSNNTSSPLEYAISVSEEGSLVDNIYLSAKSGIPYTNIETKNTVGQFSVTGDVSAYTIPVYNWNTDAVELDHLKGYMYKIDAPEGQVYSLKMEYTGSDESEDLFGIIYYPQNLSSGEYALTGTHFNMGVNSPLVSYDIPDEAYIYLDDTDWSNVRFTISKVENIASLKNSAIAITKTGTVNGTISDIGYIYNSENFTSKGFLLKTTLKPGKGYSVSIPSEYQSSIQLMMYTEEDLGVSSILYNGTDYTMPVYNSSTKDATYYVWVSVYGDQKGTIPITVSDIQFISDMDATPISLDGTTTAVANGTGEINLLTKEVDDNNTPYYELAIYQGKVYYVELPANSAYTLRYEYIGEKIENDFTFVSNLYVTDDTNVEQNALYITDTISEYYDETVAECRLVNTGNTAKKFYLLPTGSFTEGKVLISVKPIPEVKVSYRTHIQSFGWEVAENDISKWKSNGAMSGTSGKAKRLEGINIVVDSAVAGENVDLGIQYTTHCQSYGWLPWSANGEMNGTEGEAKRLEAIMIQLTGMDAECYDIYYRVHAQSYGWLGWAKNGDPAGTAGYAKRLEGIQIVVVPKGQTFNQKMEGITSARTEAFVAKAGNSPIVNYPATSNTNPVVPGDGNINVAYRTHVQSYGWQGWKYNGQMSGTSGEAKRLEGINIKLTNQMLDGDIVYTTHVQSYGWQGKLDDQSTWKKNGEMSGTSGEAKRLEAICIDLTGEMSEFYDIYYRVHAQSYGWLGWAKNGEPAGTAGYAKRLEGIQIVLVPKGEAGPANNYNGITSVRTEGYISK